MGCPVPRKKVLRSSEEFIPYLLPFYRERINWEKNLLTSRGSLGEVTLRGYCDVCQRETRFIIRKEEDGGLASLREGLICEICDLNIRHRYIFRKIRAISEERQGIDVYLPEQVSSFFHKLQSELPEARITGSEYISPDFLSGQKLHEITHQDIMALSFPDQSFDVVACSDVFEHVPNVGQAFSECCRVLRPGGGFCSPSRFPQKILQAVNAPE